MTTDKEGQRDAAGKGPQQPLVALKMQEGPEGDGAQRPLEAARSKLCPEGTQSAGTVLNATGLFTLK